MEQALATFLSPMVLFFVLGLVAAMARSQMSIPEAFAKGLAIYLMMAIGLKGGAELAKTPFSIELVLTFGLAILLSGGLPFLAYLFLRLASRMSPLDAAATAAHYGSISIVTFVAATQILDSAGIPTSGHMVAVAAVMETPAIVTALFLALRGQQGGSLVAGAERGELIREVLLNASVVVLVGALLIGWASGERGFNQVSAFFVDPFQGVLCLFLLDMGLSAGRGLRRGWRELGIGGIAFGIYMPLVSAAIAAFAGLAIGLDLGNATLLMVLAASASYIAVPAAMRLALPRANASIYLPLSLGITFPFNLTIGIPLYMYVAELLRS